MVPDLRLESSPVGHPFRFLFQTNENICDGPLMTRSESSSFLHFKNLEVNGNTFGLLSSQLSSVDQKTSRTDRLMEERSQLEKSPMMLTNRWVNKKETADCIGKHNTGYKDGKRLREDTLTLSLSQYNLYLVACPQRLFHIFRPILWVRSSHFIPPSPCTTCR